MCLNTLNGLINFFNHETNNQLEAARWTPKASETDSCPLLVEQKCSKKGWKEAHLAASPHVAKTRISNSPQLVHNQSSVATWMMVN
jgi:hypothetical protein